MADPFALCGSAVMRVLALIAGLLAAMPAFAQAYPKTEAKAVFLVDAETQSTVYSLNADAPVPPASFAKLMTAELVFEALKAGTVRMDTLFPVSEHAWRTGGAPAGVSAMFAKLKSEVAVADLLRGMLVQAGNDAAIILAEGLAGSEADFVAKMNDRAKTLGLSASRFTNASGLPGGDAQVTMRDMVRLALHIQAAYPDQYRIFSEPEFTWNGIRQLNRNPLLAKSAGVDGLMTGFTEASGYGIVLSAKRGARRLAVATAGFPSVQAREEGVNGLLEWAFNETSIRDLFDAGAVVGRAEVFGGAEAGVDLAPRKDVSLLLPDASGDAVTGQIVYRGPLLAPVEKDAEVAKFIIRVDGAIVAEYPLVAVTGVAPAELSTRAMGAIRELAVGWLR